MEKIINDLEAELASLYPVGLDEQIFAKLEEAMNNPISSDQLRALESQLASLDPITLDLDQLERFEASMVLVSVESELKKLAPIEMDMGLFTRLNASMEAVSSESSLHIATFTPPAKTPSYFGPWAAAAVVVIGVLSFFFLAHNSNTTTGAERGGNPSASSIQPFRVSDVPVGKSETSLRLVSSSEEGVVLSNDKPYRMVRFVTEEVETVTDSDGRIYELRRPGERFTLVPVPTN
jgi:hypothetical protein